jgi:hypothetical protein
MIGDGIHFLCLWRAKWSAFIPNSCFYTGRWFLLHLPGEKSMLGGHLLFSTSSFVPSSTERVTFLIVGFWERNDYAQIILLAHVFRILSLLSLFSKLSRQGLLWDHDWQPFKAGILEGIMGLTVVIPLSLILWSDWHFDLLFICLSVDFKLGEEYNFIYWYPS